ncbi:N-terminal nucleophile aminohydrolase [Trametopsis cervina]|nr:N-terminal nucleophile aminohydrolase [Trametopsis cervina]
MCRWFAYLSNSEPCLLEDVLVEPAHSLAKQVSEHYLPGLVHHEPDEDLKSTEKEVALRNRLFNADGLGVVWYNNTREEYGECDGPRPIKYKVLRQPLTDPVFRSICENTSSQAVFAHIRAASGDTAITEVNCHPYTFGRWSFMHNGVVSHFKEIKRHMVNSTSQEAINLVMGTTDSEHLGALLFTYLEEDKGAQSWDHSHPLQDVKAALEKAITKILEIQKQVVPANTIEPCSLNIAITDGEQLLAIRFRNHATQHPPSLYYSTAAGVRLNRKFPGHPDQHGKDNGKTNLKAEEEHGDHIIVASEPTTFHDGEWKLIEKNQCIMVGKDMVVHHEAVNVQF